MLNIVNLLYKQLTLANCLKEENICIKIKQCHHFLGVIGPQT